MFHARACCVGLVGSIAIASAAQAATVFNDTDPSTSNWFCVGNGYVNTHGVDATGLNNAPIALAGGTNLRLTGGRLTPPDNGKSHNPYDNFAVVRALPSAINLGVGDWLQVEAKATAPSSPLNGGKNAFRDLRGFGVRFIGKGAVLDFPTENTLVSPGTFEGTTDYTFVQAPTLAQNRTSFNLGVDVTFNGAQNNNGRGNSQGNGGTTGNDQLYRSANAPNFVNASPNFSANWTGDQFKFRFERLADDSNGFAVYQISTTLTQLDGVTLLTMSNTTSGASSNNNLGTLWTHLAFGVGDGSGVSNSAGQTNSISADLMLDNILVTTSVPEPASLGVMGLAVLALGRRRR